MKKLILILTVLFLSFSVPAYAAPDDGLALKSGDAKVAVNGLVCDFCARALEKVFGKQEEVNAINVDLDTKIISVSFNEGQNLDDDTITNLITDSGYNVESIDRVE